MSESEQDGGHGVIPVSNRLMAVTVIYLNRHIPAAGRSASVRAHMKLRSR